MPKVWGRDESSRQSKLEVTSIAKQIWTLNVYNAFHVPWYQILRHPGIFSLLYRKWYAPKCMKTSCHLCRMSIKTQDQRYQIRNSVVLSRRTALGQFEAVVYELGSVEICRFLFRYSYMFAGSRTEAAL